MAHATISPPCRNGRCWALYEAANLAGGRRIVQISARTDGDGAATKFLATKRRADAALKASGLDHVILRPAVVIGRNAHGGTALVRALASFPFVIPAVHARSPVATVALDDVAEAVARAVDGRLQPGSDLDLAATGALTLGEVLALHRGWLGLAPAKVKSVPAFLARPVTALADLAGRLGWRSPLRSTSLAVMEGGVEGGGATPAPFALRSLAQTLCEKPVGRAGSVVRAALFAQGAGAGNIVGLLAAVGADPAGRDRRQPWRISTVFFGYRPALLTVIATCALDIGLGLAVLWRRFARRALWGDAGRLIGLSRERQPRAAKPVARPARTAG